MNQYKLERENLMKNEIKNQDKKQNITKVYHTPKISELSVNKTKGGARPKNNESLTADHHS